MALDEATRKFFAGKSILVTGGCGSIGSVIVEELLACDPKVVRVYSRDEGKHFETAERLHQHKSKLRFLVGDIRDRARLDVALKGIQIVFHAAALKHVPACEYNPFEAVKTNVIGTQNVIEAAVGAGVSHLVAVSTDKAAQPVNTMGASKLMAEKLVAAADSWNPGTKLASVRFGNVVGSRGSVVPAMIESILTSGEVRVTDGAMTRFLMTIRDAVQLTLRACRESAGGEIFVFRMPAVRLSDLVDVIVEETCRRSGLASGAIQRSEIGIRAGEKMHEALFSEDEAARTEDRGELFVVHGLDEWERNGRKGWGQIDTDALLSDRAQLLDRQGIIQLLESAGVWERLRS